LIIAILFQKLVEGGAAAGGFLDLEFEAEGREKPDDLREAEFAESAVLKSVEGGVADFGLLCERGLAHPQRLATGGDPGSYIG
jgi:hypothetical protein